jgi:hypothetical protein
MRQRQQAGRGRAQPCGQIRHLPGDVRNERRLACRERPRDNGRFVGTGNPGIGSQFVEAVPGRRLQGIVARIVLEQQCAGSTGHVDGVLMQMW